MQPKASSTGLTMVNSFDSLFFLEIASVSGFGSVRRLHFSGRFVFLQYAISYWSNMAEESQTQQSVVTAVTRAPLLPWSDDVWKRWSEQKRMSARPVPRTKFLVIKTPASTIYETKFGGDFHMFTISMFVQRMIGKNIIISAAMDCTSIDINTFSNHCQQPQQYYFHNAQEWDDFDIQYVSLVEDGMKDASGPSSSPVPTERTVQKFIELCQQQWRDRPNTHICVFDCFGGLGAAGYLVTCYMVEQLRAPLTAALKSLADVMPPGIFHPSLLHSLQTRYKGNKEIEIPLAPSWWIGDVTTSNNTPSITTILPYLEQSAKLQPEQEATSSSQKKRCKVYHGELSIPGLEYCPPNSAKYLRATSVLQQLLGLTDSCKSFVGCSEYSLTSSSIYQISPKSYHVTWNPIGRRGFLLLLADGVFFIEPDSHESKLTVSLAHSMHFPSPKDLQKPQHRTLLDGRLIFDKENGTTTTKIVPRFLAMDVLAHEGGILLHKPFLQRRKFLVDGVYGARKRLQRKPEEEKECFRFRVHDTFELRKAEYLLSESFLQQVTHDVDGLQFIPIEAPYKLSTDAAAATTEENGNSNSIHNKLLIWKQSDHEYLSSPALLAQIKEKIGASDH